MVSDGSNDAVDVRPSGPSQELHIALVVPDLRTFRSLSEGAYVISDATGRDVAVTLHVLQGTKEEASELTQKHALVQLGLVSPTVARLQYPEQIELGWKEKQPL